MAEVVLNSAICEVDGSNRALIRVAGDNRKPAFAGILVLLSVMEEGARRQLLALP